MFFVVFGGCFYPFGGPISCWCAKNGDGADTEDTSRKTRMGVLFQQPDFAVVLFSAGMERDAGKIADGHFLGDGFHDGMGLARESRFSQKVLARSYTTSSGMEASVRRSILTAVVWTGSV